MSKPIIWSELAITDFESILGYLQSQWDRKVIIQYIDVVDKLIQQISVNPKQFPFINKSKKRAMSNSFSHS